jgi:hypothetical protein
MYENS